MLLIYNIIDNIKKQNQKKKNYYFMDLNLNVLLLQHP